MPLHGRSPFACTSSALLIGSISHPAEDTGLLIRSGHLFSSTYSRPKTEFHSVSFQNFGPVGTRLNGENWYSAPAGVPSIPLQRKGTVGNWRRKLHHTHVNHADSRIDLIGPDRWRPLCTFAREAGCFGPQKFYIFCKACRIITRLRCNIAGKCSAAPSVACFRWALL